MEQRLEVAVKSWSRCLSRVLSSCHTQDHLQVEELALLQLALLVHVDHPLESPQQIHHLSCRLLEPQEWALEGQARLEEAQAGLEAWL